MATTEVDHRETLPVTGIVVLAAGLALMTTLSWRAAAGLPDPVIFAGGGRDGADTQAPRLLVLTVMPLLALTIGGVGLAAQRLRRRAAALLKVPLWRDDRTHRRSIDLALGILTPVLAAVHLTMLRAAEDRLESGPGWLAAAVALVVIVIGNIWPKQAPALPDLLRTRLSSPTRDKVDRALETQRRHLRSTGIAMVLVGLVALACAWSVPPISLALSLLAVLVMGAVPLVTVVRRQPQDVS
jgi:hypothetical protein